MSSKSRCSISRCSISYTLINAFTLRKLPQLSWSQESTEEDINKTSAPTLLIISTMPGTWCIEALFRITTLWGLTPLKGMRCGRGHFTEHHKINHHLLLQYPLLFCNPEIPLTLINAIEFRCWPLTNSLCVLASPAVGITPHSISAVALSFV